MKYEFIDKYGRIVLPASSLKEAKELGEDTIREAFKDADFVGLVHAEICERDESGEEIHEKISVFIEPEEPDCTPTRIRHDWVAKPRHDAQDKKVTTHTCSHCGITRKVYAHSAHPPGCEVCDRIEYLSPDPGFVPDVD